VNNPNVRQKLRMWYDTDQSIAQTVGKERGPGRAAKRELLKVKGKQTAYVGNSKEGK
jgi:hypothetical protein